MRPRACNPTCSATVKRSDRGRNLPAAADAVEILAAPGAGGVSATAGGAPSTLEAGAVATIEKAAAKLPGGGRTAPGGAAEFAVGTAPVATLGGPVRAGGKAVPVVAVETTGSPVGRTVMATSPVGAVATAAPETTSDAATRHDRSAASGPAVEATATTADRRGSAGLPDAGAPRSGELAAPAGGPRDRPPRNRDVRGRNDARGRRPAAAPVPPVPRGKPLRTPAAMALADTGVTAPGAAAGSAGEARQHVARGRVHVGQSRHRRTAGCAQSPAAKSMARPSSDRRPLRPASRPVRVACRRAPIAARRWPQPSAADHWAGPTRRGCRAA